MMLVTPIKGEKFTKGVAFAKRYGGKFDGQAKCWRMSESFVRLCEECRGTRTIEQYLRLNGLEIVQPSGSDVATTYRGQSSMDAADSIF